VKPVQQRTLRRKRLSEELTAQIRRYIIDQGLRPGDPLLTEQEMVKRFGVSRSVVREATKALDFLGIIDSVPRRGMVLDNFSFDRVSDYFGFHFALSDYPKEDLLKARAVVETGTLFYVMEAMRKDSAVYDRLLESAEAIADADDVDQRIDRDIAFHRALVEASDIAPLASFCDLLQVFFRRFRDRTAVGDFRLGARQHRRIVEALHEGKLEEAIDLLRQHFHWYEQNKGS
jgi:DNA-binding FadR family transcriptional regulator